MKLLNLFLILIILYLCYKIFNNNEKFQEVLSTTSERPRINLDNTEIINNKNIFINYSQDQLEELNKIPEIDLNKRNLIIDNSNADKEKVSISNNLCVGNFCINEDNLKTISGKIDGPQFYKTMKKNDSDELYDKPIYYNNDCNLLSNTTPFNKCDISNVNDLPNKLCFNVEEEMPEVITTSVSGTTSTFAGNPTTKRASKVCIEAKDFDILNGRRGIKLKHLNSNKVDSTEYNKKLDYYIKKDKELDSHISDYYDPNYDPNITSTTSATGNQYKPRELCSTLLPPTLNKDTNKIEQKCCRSEDSCVSDFIDSAQGKLYKYEWHRRNKIGSKYGENDKECDNYNLSDNTRLPKLEGEDYGKCCNEVYPGKDCLTKFLKEHKKDLLIEDILENISYSDKTDLSDNHLPSLNDSQKQRHNINVNLKNAIIIKIDSIDSNTDNIVTLLVGYLSKNKIKKYLDYDDSNNNYEDSQRIQILRTKILHWRSESDILIYLIDNLSDRKLKKYVKTIGDGKLDNDRSGCNKKNTNWKLPPSKTQDAKCCNEAYPGEGKKKCIDGFKKENPNYLDGIDKPDSKDTGTSGKFDLKCPMPAKWRLPDNYCCGDSDPNGRYHGIDKKSECVIHYFNKYYNIDNETKLADTKYDHDKYLMPYYLDFKQSGFNIEGTKDQLFFKNNDECTHNNSLYKLNPQFDPRKYPFYKSKLEELNCNIEEYDCWEDCKPENFSNGKCPGKTVSKRARLCPHTCKKALEAEFFGSEDKCNDNQPVEKHDCQTEFERSITNRGDRQGCEWRGGEKGQGYYPEETPKKEDYCAFGIYPDDQKVDYELQRKWHENTYYTDGMFRGYVGTGDDANAPVKGATSYDNTYEEDSPPDTPKPKKKVNTWIRDCGSLNKGDIKVKDGECIPKGVENKSAGAIIGAVVGGVFSFGLGSVVGAAIGAGIQKAKGSGGNEVERKICESGKSKQDETCSNESNNYENHRCTNRYESDDLLETETKPNRYCLNYKSKEVNKQGEKEKIITKKDRGKTGKYKSYCPRLGKRDKNGNLGTDRWGFDSVPDSADPFRILENGCCVGQIYYEGVKQTDNIQTKEECIQHYEAALKKDETSVENNHGWYMLPDNVPIDPTYNGYYIDQNNNNTKYLMKDNAISKASKYLGIIDNHRSSDNGKCGYDIFNGAQANYFCDGKNSNNSKYDNLCNPITFVEKQIQEQAGLDADDAEEVIEEDTKIYHGNCLRNSPYESKEDCASGQVRWTPTSCKKKKGERNYRCVPQVKVEPTKATNVMSLNDQISAKRSLESETVSNPLTEYKSSDNRSDIEEVHYVLNPAKDTAGNIIKSNTYFHGHEHSH
tara:strand:+ start:267 stop:4289 length:4023 start_codon:yes stop_codon:yes gene_type:complete